MLNQNFYKMKTKILSFLFVLTAALLLATNAMAANEGTATVGATKTYTVSATTGTPHGTTPFEWAITPGVSGTAWSGTSTTGSINITWLAAGTYEVKVRMRDSNGCYTEYRTKSVVVSATDYTIAGQTNTTTCSLLVGSLDGNVLGTPDNTTFNVTLSNVPSEGATYTVVYTVGGVEVAPIENYVSGSLITVTHSDYYAQFSNTTDTAANTAITVTSVKRTGETVAIPVKATTGITTYNVSVQPKPVITSM